MEVRVEKDGGVGVAITTDLDEHRAMTIGVHKLLEFIGLHIHVVGVVGNSQKVRDIKSVTLAIQVLQHEDVFILKVKGGCRGRWSCAELDEVHGRLRMTSFVVV